jgi:hypothetical protein
VVDTAEPTVASLVATGAGLGTGRGALVRHGARHQYLWRYHDMGLTLLDQIVPVTYADGTFNLDIEGLHWAPSTGSLLLDNFPQFQMSVAHTKFLPDEAIAMGAFLFPLSGLSDTFDDNLLDPLNDPYKLVHPSGSGYTVHPNDVFTAFTGTRMTPWPMNLNTPTSQFVRYTWRDTGKTAVGGPNGGGADYTVARTFDAAHTQNNLYTVDNVPTIALPLLMEFRVQPSPNSNASNRLLGVFASPAFSPGQVENQPYFSAVDGGGIDLQGGTVTVNPDSSTTAQGFYPGGPGNLGRSQFLHFGQADFVVRVNRVHTVWFDASAVSSFATPVIEPSIASMPPGTQVTFAFRGATGLTGTGSPWTDATNIDPYGNPRSGVTYTTTFLGGNSSWRPSMADINGAQLFQVRMTLASNAESGASPELTSLGFAFWR